MDRKLRAIATSAVFAATMVTGAISGGASATADQTTGGTATRPATRATVFQGASGSVFDERPQFLGISNDGFTHLADLRWKRWTRTHARAKGVLSLRIGSQNGLPLVRRYRAIARVGVPSDGHFTSLVVRYGKGQKTRVVRWKLVASEYSGDWMWQ